ncbi:alpha-mannosidase [Scenedesmus sp. PABB004]|nr:alpha-mannosidase [Scenedesmus sp. PABB004]
MQLQARAFRAAGAPRGSARPQPQARGRVLLSAQAKAAAPTGTEEYIEVDLPKPLGLKFARGADGGAYVTVNDPQLGNTDPRIQPGDKITKISASFGSDVWDAQNFGQIMYAIRTRNGTVYMQIKRNFGDMSALQEEVMDAAERQAKSERAGGNYGAGTKELQSRNYVSRKEQERKRRELFDDALAKFNKGDVEGALVDFENVVALEPRNYVGDNLSRVTPILPVAHYNIACCYSMLGQADEGVKSLDLAMACGFEDYAKVRSDKNLAAVRGSPKFERLINMYDEPVINWAAVENTLGVFGKLFKKDKAVSEHFAAAHARSPEALAQVPVLSRDTADGLPPSSLVRLRGMVADMFNPEFFLGAYRLAPDQPWRPGALYTDAVPDEVDAAGETTIMERRPLLVVPVPGEQPWATAAWAGRPVEPPTPSASERAKRVREPSAEPAAGGAAADDGGDDTGAARPAGANKAQRVAGGPEPGAPAVELDALRRSGASDQGRPQPAGAADEHAARQPAFAPGDCIVQVYGAGDSLALHDVVEVLGVLSVVPDIAAMHIARRGAGERGGGAMQLDGDDGDDVGGDAGGDDVGGANADADAGGFWEHRTAALPPTSQVLRLHALTIRKVAPNPAAANPERALALPPAAQLPALRAAALSLLAAPLAGDELAAEYLLLASLGQARARGGRGGARLLPLPRAVVDREAGGATGLLPLNLTHVPASAGSSKACQLVPGLAAALGCLLPHVSLLPLSTASLNARRWYPQQHGDSGRLFRGALQLPDSAVLLLDETGMAAGQLSDAGVKNLQALRSVLEQQQLPCDCQVYTTTHNVNTPAVVLSTGRSVLRESLPLALPLVPARPVLVKPGFEDQQQRAGGGACAPAPADWLAADVAGPEAVSAAAAGLGGALGAVRDYLAAARRASVRLDQAGAEACVARFRAAQAADPGLGLDDLHRLITMAKLLSASLGHEAFSMESWERCMQLEALRKARVAAAAPPAAAARAAAPRAPAPAARAAAAAAGHAALRARRPTTLMAGRSRAALLALLGLAALAAPLVGARSGLYNTTGGPVAGKLNVHIISHTHNDPGWLSSYVQYHRTLVLDNHVIGGVEAILDTSVSALVDNPDRTFVYADLAFFTKWWQELHEDTRAVVRRLVQEGRFEFTNGGITQHDEATSHYSGMVDQMTLGMTFLREEFGVSPRIAWQLDGFGHSRTEPLLKAMGGFDALFFGRSDVADFDQRKAAHNLELVWRGSETYGAESDLWMSQYPTGNYGPPSMSWFFERRNDYAKPLADSVKDDPETNSFNLDEVVNTFVAKAKEWQACVQGNDVMFMMGSDFTHSDARAWFANVDKMIHYVNRDGRVNAFYSTPSRYVAAKRGAGLKFALKTDDFFPYSGNAQGTDFWTGYFTSRPTLKAQVRRGAALLQATRQVEVLAELQPSSRRLATSRGLAYDGGQARSETARLGAALAPGHDAAALDFALATALHHDGITGTQRAAVTRDYEAWLHIATAKAAPKFLQGLAALVFPGRGINALRPAGAAAGNATAPAGAAGAAGRMPVGAIYRRRRALHQAGGAAAGAAAGAGAAGAGGAGSVPELQMCLLLNATLCSASVSLSRGPGFLLVVYNPLAWSYEWGITVPVDDGGYTVTGPDGAPVASQLLPVSRAEEAAWKHTGAPDGAPRPKAKLALLVSAPPLGHATYTVKRGAGAGAAAASTSAGLAGQDAALSTGPLRVRVTPGAGGIASMSLGGAAAHNFTTELIKYSGGGLSRSGAYTFKANAAPDGVAKPEVTIVRGPVVSEVHQVWPGELGSIVTRLWKGASHLEVGWYVGPPPGGANWEVFVRYSSSLRSGGVWYTDANGREYQQRKRGYRPSFKLPASAEALPGNIYPVTTGAYLEDGASGLALSVAVDRAAGVASMADGQLDLNVHRVSAGDDGKGMSEPLTDGALAAGTHVVSLAPAAPPAGGGSGGSGSGVVGTPRHHEQVLNDPLQLAFAALPPDGVAVAPSSTGLSAPGALPPGVHVLTLKWLSCERVLLRLSHMFQAGEHPSLGATARVDLHALLKLGVVGAVEAALYGERALTDADDARPAQELGANLTTWDPPLPRTKGYSFLSNRLVGPIPPGTHVSLHPMQIRTFYLTVRRADSACTDPPRRAKPVAAASSLVAPGAGTLAAGAPERGGGADSGGGGDAAAALGSWLGGVEAGVEAAVGAGVDKAAAWEAAAVDQVRRGIHRISGAEPGGGHHAPLSRSALLGMLLVPAGVAVGIAVMLFSSARGPSRLHHKPGDAKRVARQSARMVRCVTALLLLAAALSVANAREVLGTRRPAPAAPATPAEVEAVLTPLLGGADAGVPDVQPLDPGEGLVADAATLPPAGGDARAARAAPAQTGPADPLLAALLDKHNAFRARYGAPPLTWSAKLATSAQAYADICANGQLAHSQLGQNLGFTGGDLAPDSMATSMATQFKGWTDDEASLYDYNKPVLDARYGHFTQVVWYSSTQIGCGYKTKCSFPSAPVADFKVADFTVCHFDPPGNFGSTFSWNVLRPGTPVKVPTARITDLSTNRAALDADTKVSIQSDPPECLTSDTMMTYGSGYIGWRWCLGSLRGDMGLMNKQFTLLPSANLYPTPWVALQQNYSISTVVLNPASGALFKSPFRLELKGGAGTTRLTLRLLNADGAVVRSLYDARPPAGFRAPYRLIVRMVLVIVDARGRCVWHNGADVQPKPLTSALLNTLSFYSDRQKLTCP